jgi:hypothetical protein
MIDTGRSSSKTPLAVHHVRSSSYRPKLFKPGQTFIQTDYSALEIRTWAQCYEWLARLEKAGFKPWNFQYDLPDTYKGFLYIYKGL